MTRRITRLGILFRLFCLAAVVAACGRSGDEGGAANADGEAQQLEPVNDLPGPYERIEPWAELPPGAVQWGQVTGVEQGPDGHLYVMHRCFENSCAGRSEDPIVKYDMSGRPLASWGAGLFNYPHGFYVDAEGNVWATDARGNGELGHQVFKFSSDGELLLTLGQAGVAGLGPDVFNQPTDVLVLPGGDFLVTEGHGEGNDRVVRFSPEGDFLDAWGGPGSGPGQFSTPHAIARDSQGRIFIGDRANNRIQIFLEDGTFLEEWKQFSRPSGIFIDDDDTIYVADSESWGPNNPGWKKGIRIGSARDGSVSYFIEDIESTTIEHSGAEAVGVDSEGNVYGGVVRRRMLEKHVRVR